MNEIKDLVATAISEPLFNKIRGNIAVPQSITSNYYISATGNDGNDGSEARPFKTLSHCLYVIYSTLGNCVSVKKATINFLSDYTHSDPMHFYRHAPNLTLSFNANNHNVIFNSVACNSSNLEFVGISFKPNKALSHDAFVTAVFSSNLTLKNCKLLQPTISGLYYILSGGNSFISIQDSLTIDVGDKVTDAIILSITNSILDIVRSNVSVLSPVTVKSFLSATRQSQITIYNDARFSDNGHAINAMKYGVYIQSSINTSGRGEALFIGNKAGEVLTDGKVY